MLIVDELTRLDADSLLGTLGLQRGVVEFDALLATHLGELLLHHWRQSEIE